MALINLIGSDNLNSIIGAGGFKNKVLAALGVSGKKMGAVTLGLKVLAFAGLAAVLGIVAFIAKELLIPIGSYGKKAIEGGGIVLLIIAGLGGIMIAIDAFAKNASTLPLKIAMLGGMVLILALVSFISLELLIPIG